MQKIREIPTFKFMLLGESGVGKTSLYARFTESAVHFSTSHVATLGVDFQIKTLELERKVPAKIEIWDTAGQERFRSITASYFSKADALLLVVDVVDPESVDKAANDWLPAFRKNNTKDAPVILVCNKMDLATEDRKDKVFTAHAAADFVQKHKCFGCVPTCAADEKDRNFEQAIRNVTKYLYANRYPQVLQSSSVTLTSGSTEQQYQQQHSINGSSVQTMTSTNSSGCSC
jgi:small GTP-binding protein